MINTNKICGRLSDLAASKNVEVLYAAESGSRCWGVESTDSDWDIRFIYIQKPEEYLRLRPGKDTISLITDDKMDFAGWDLKKALILGAKSNPSLIEWLSSPIVYVDNPDLTLPLRNIMEGFSERALGWHYFNLANRQVVAYWKPNEPVRYKKYLYAIRPILCIGWMINNSGIPPLNFNWLLSESDVTLSVHSDITKLLQMKEVSTEIEGEGRFPCLDSFIESELDRLPHYIIDLEKKQVNAEKLNNLFRNLVTLRLLEQYTKESLLQVIETDKIAYDNLNPTGDNND